jgi:ketosteroid isomerase-like protein
MTERNQENQAVVRVVFEGFNAGDVERVAALCAPDFTLHDMPAGPRSVRPAGMRLWLQTWLDAAPDAHAALERIFGQGDWVATEHHGTATHTGPLRTPTGEIPATGRALDLWFSENFEVRGGKLRQMRAYDDAAVMRQLGLLDAGDRVTG